jgi:hypothetical protein
LAPAGGSPSAAAAWWLQQAAPAPAAPQGDQYMMQAYVEAMQRIAPHQQQPSYQQPSSYGYWTAPAAQPSAADMYWQQQNAYQPGPGRYGATAPRRI